LSLIRLRVYLCSKTDLFGAQAVVSYLRQLAKPGSIVLS